MRKIILLALLISLSAKNYAQIKIENMSSKDSMDLLQDFIGLMKESGEPSNYFTIGTGIGNKLFSEHNNAINSKESSVSTLVYSPAVTYYNKSGLNIAVGAN